MESDLQDHKLLYKVAKAYYEDSLTQQQIAGRLGLSRVKVSRMLGRARSAGVVQISITPPTSSDADLERDIETRYGLKEAVVVACPDHDSHAILAELGPAAARYLLRCLQGHEVVAMSWGSTLLAVVDSLPAANLPDLRVVQIIGGLGEVEAQVHGAELVRRTARSLAARPRLLHAPGIVKNQSVCDALVGDPQIAGTLQLAAQADVALVGLGELCKGSTLLGTQVLTQTQIHELEVKGAVGDIALRFFDGNGTMVHSRIDTQIVGLDIEALRKIPRVIGVAGGRAKLNVIRAALSGGLIDVLITDDRTAQDLLKGSQQ